MLHTRLSIVLCTASAHQGISQKVDSLLLDLAENQKATFPWCFPGCNEMQLEPAATVTLGQEQPAPLWTITCVTDPPSARGLTPSGCSSK